MIIVMHLGANGNVSALTPVNDSGIRAYFDLVRLTPLLERTGGRPEIKLGLIDGPVVIDHPVSSITPAEVESRAAQVALQAPKVWLGR